MFSIENKFYTAALRWKKGEMEALGSLDEVSKERLLPHIVFPPLSARDIEKRRTLSRDEFANLQIGRLQRFWTGRPCLTDFRFLQLDPDDKGSDAARISELLATSRTFGCKLIPVLDAQCDSYRMNALAAHIHNANSGGAIRISLNDLQNDKLGELLATLLASVRLKASDCVLVVDLSDATISDHAIFAKFISEWLSKLRHFGSWRRIIVEASSYPTKNPAAPNSESRTSRDEWLCWLNLAKSDPGILEWASFGDFGADHGQIAFGGGGRTVTHLRYATAKHWIVGRGGDPTSDHDGTIHTVAKRIVSTGEFMGEGFSAGDEFILACAEKSSPGNGSTWRWANMVHHMTLATAGVGDLIGSPIERPKRAVRAKQLSLLTAGD